MTSNAPPGGDTTTPAKGEIPAPVEATIQKSPPDTKPGGDAAPSGGPAAHMQPALSPSAPVTLRVQLPQSAGQDLKPATAVHTVDLGSLTLAVPANARPWQAWHTLLDLAIIVVLVLQGIAAQPWLATHNFPAARWLSHSLTSANGRLLFWLAELLLLVGFLAITGHGITGRVEGVLIDGRNRMSLSRLQLVVWTVVVLTAYYTAILWRLTASSSAPTDFGIPQELWLAMGISVTAFVGTPLVLSTKVSRPADPAQTQQTFTQLTLSGSPAARGGTVVTDTKGSQRSAIVQGEAVTVTHRGQLVVKSSPANADWADMFRGEETGNAAQVDLSKVQQFYFTVIVVTAYVAVICQMFTGIALPANLPPLSQSLVALLALSSGGYLVNKAVPHSQTPQGQ